MLATARPDRSATRHRNRERRDDALQVVTAPPSEPVDEGVLTALAVRTWSVVGQNCEAIGDYSRASDAYAHAYASEPDAELAIAASSNAESAGDTAGALEYCALALRTAQGDDAGATETPKKGGH
jgi:hypothetical protein